VKALIGLILVASAFSANAKSADDIINSGVSGNRYLESTDVQKAAMVAGMSSFLFVFDDVVCFPKGMDSAQTTDLFTDFLRSPTSTAFRHWNIAISYRELVVSRFPCKKEKK